MEKCRNMETFSKGFTRVPHKISNVLPLLNLTEREQRVVALIIRLTYGCNRRWIQLKQADLQIVNITPSHAKEVRNSLINKKIIIQKECKREYRINEDYIASSEVEKKISCQLEKLRILIGRQLNSQTSLKSNKSLTESGSTEFPNMEDSDYQIGNNKQLPNEEVSATNNNVFNSPKDILNKDKYKDIKDRFSYNRSEKHINPNGFYPQNETEFEMFESFRLIDNANPDSFSFYISTLQKGLPARKFREFREDILRTPKIKNKGSVFVTKVQQYFEGVKNE